jgi:uncharacterized protein YjbJ (UPF0337 family)
VRSRTQIGPELSPKGSVKETAGRLTGDAALEAEGQMDKVKGEAKGTKGKLKELFK